MSDTLELPEEWGICGCANEPALKLLRDILRLMNDKGPAFLPGRVGGLDPYKAWVTDHIAARETLAGGKAQWELFMHYVDKMGWSEHGGGINSSWLTGEGEAALSHLETLELDE